MNTSHWSSAYLNPKRTYPISHNEMLRVLWTKYELDEINFIEFKDRVRALNTLHEWVEGFYVSSKAYARFNTGREVVSTPAINSRFLALHKDRKFSDIDQYGVEDFPKHPNEEKEDDL